MPCALIGRLAVDVSVHGQGIGHLLVADAIKRVSAAAETVAMHAVIVDAANDSAKHFYERFGFAPLTDEPMRLFLSLGGCRSARLITLGVYGFTKIRAERG